ncbi:MAG: phosphotransferase [Proteobacteria bacterium]|nr:phosphotransferase [Pseudomonadota bacterium]
MADWDADVAIDLDRVRQLIATHVPELAGKSVVVAGEGWDNAAFLVDGAWLFRFPRRAIAGQFMTAELATLTALPDLGLPIPRPVFQVIDPPDYPHSFAGYRRLNGVDGDQCVPGTVTAAGQVGTFLARLHATPIPDAVPGDTLGYADLVRRTGHVRERLPTVRALAPDLPWDGIEAVLAGAQAPAPERICLVHGDLYPRHVLIDEDGGATGIIDWGDVHRGDPSVDLPLAFTWFTSPARERFFAAYQRAGGLLEKGQRERARYRALQYAVYLLPYAHERGELGLRHVAEHAVRETVADAN